MARSFDGTSDAITTTPGAFINGATKLAIVFWLNWTTNADDDDLAMEYSPNFGTNSGTFFIDPNESSTHKVQVGIRINNISTAEFTRPSAGTWHSWVINLDGTVAGAGAIPTIYIDGSSQSLSNAVALSSTGSFANHSLYLMSRAVTSLFGAGAMAELAIYKNINLTASEAGALAKGYSPMFVRPSAMILFQPMLRFNESYKDASIPTLTGTTVSPHPGIIMPRGHRILTKFTAPPPTPLRAQIWM